MKYIVFTVISLMISTAYAADYKVAVIDTGLSGFFADEKTMQLKCKKGHYDFTTNRAKVGCIRC